jgi:transposase
MSLPYEELLKKAQVAAEQVRVELSEKELTFPKKKEKQKDDPEPKKKNQLVTIPKTMEASFAGRVREQDLEVDDPIHILWQKFENGEIDQSDLSVDDKFVLIRYLKTEKGLKQDEIAEKLGVTRRTVVNYYKKIKELDAQTLADSDIWEIGGEIYSQGIQIMEAALRKGDGRQWSYVLTSMISTLQSLGLVFKMPKQSQVSQQIIHNMAEKKGQEGFKQLKIISANEEINLDSVFNEIMGAVKNGQIDKKDVNKKD